MKSAGNITVTFNSNNITAYLDQVELQATVDELETTNLASTAQESDPGLGKWTVSFASSKWDSTLDGYLAPSVTTPTKRTCVIAIVGGAQTVTYTWTTQAYITNYNIAATAKGAHTTAPKLTLSGNPSRASA